MEYVILKCPRCGFLFVERYLIHAPPSWMRDIHRCPRCGWVADVLSVFKPSLTLRLLGWLSRLPLVGHLFLKLLLDRALYEAMEKWRGLKA